MSRRGEDLEAKVFAALGRARSFSRTADMTWEQAIAMEEYAEPICFTMAARQEAIATVIKTHGIAKGPL